MPANNNSVDASIGVRALVVVPTRELAHQIHNECLKLAQGRKWKIVLFNKSTANALSQKEARDKVGRCPQRSSVVLEKVITVQIW